MSWVEPSATVKLELAGIGNGWTDVTDDLTDEDIVLQYGITTNPPTPGDRCALPGTLTFGLRNGLNNSAGTVGYYSPFSASARAGFGFNIRAQYGLTYGGVTNYYIGKVRGIKVDSDPWASLETHVTAYGWMDDAGRSPAKVALLSMQRSGQAFSALVAAVATPPDRTSIDVGADTYIYAFDNIWSNAKVSAAMADLVRSELGYCGEKRDTISGQTVFFEDRHHRSTIMSLRATLNKTIHDVQVLQTADAILNNFLVTVYPRFADTGATDIVASLVQSSSPTPIAPMTSETFNLNFTAPALRTAFIGAANVVTPLVASTDYLMNTVADGSGFNQTGSFTVTGTVYGSSIAIVVTNTSTTTAAFITKLQVRGDAIYALQAVTGAGSAAAGDTLCTLDMPFQSDPLKAANFAQYLATLYSPAAANLSAITFCANQSDTLMQAARDWDISDKFAVGDIVNGIPTSQTFYTNAITLTLTERNRLDVTLLAVPGDSQKYWLIGVAGASELGSTTFLGI
jgi:hypothetical protein